MRTWLRDARLAKHLTQEQVADAINLNRVSYQRLESGKSGNYLNVVKFYALASLLSLPIEKAILLEVEYNSEVLKIKNASSGHLAV